MSKNVRIFKVIMTTIIYIKVLFFFLLFFFVCFFFFFFFCVCVRFFAYSCLLHCWYCNDYVFFPRQPLYFGFTLYYGVLLVGNSKSGIVTYVRYFSVAWPERN